MELTEVTQRIIHSLAKNSSSKLGTFPRVVSLLGVSKKRKEDAVKQAFFDYINGNEVVLLISVSTSSKLFQFILSKVPQIWFIEGRVLERGKRKDVMALMFTRQKFMV